MNNYILIYYVQKIINNIIYEVIYFNVKNIYIIYYAKSINKRVFG